METTTHLDRVQANTNPDINARIRYETEARIMRLVAAGPEAIDARLVELDNEWDVERVLTTKAASIMIASALFSVAKGRGWLLLGGTVAAFLLQHSLQGWCPPLGIIRRMGYRTQREIDEERAALKLIRGDFDQIAPDQALVAAER